MGHAGGGARALVLLALVGVGCGMPGSGVGGAGGGAGGDTGAGGGAPPVTEACPYPVERGAPCAHEVTPSCPLTGCEICIGGLWKRTFSPVLICACIDGAWACPGGPDFHLPSGSISDCVVEVPVTCEEARAVYTSATCTEHPSCAP